MEISDIQDTVEVTSEASDIARRAAIKCLKHENVHPSEVEVSIVFVDDSHIGIESERRTDGPTDVLSFPMDDPVSRDEPVPLGDIVISLETVERETQDSGFSITWRSLSCMAFARWVMTMRVMRMLRSWKGWKPRCLLN